MRARGRVATERGRARAFRGEQVHERLRQPRDLARVLPEIAAVATEFGQDARPALGLRAGELDRNGGGEPAA